LHRLVEELETFARDGAKPWPILRPSPAPPPSSDEGVDTANGRE
jgi:hypothetical protein